MTQVTINGNTYSDDGSSAKDMLNGGHRQWFFPLVSDVVVTATDVAADAAQAAIDAANAAAVAGSTKATSTTSLTNSAGTKNLTVQTGKQFTPGSFVTISRTSAPTTLMHGVVNTYSGSSLQVIVGYSAGAVGPFSDWTVFLSGAQGIVGASGNGSVGYLAKTAAYTVLATDNGKIIDCTANSFTLSFQGAATLGSTWFTYIRNSGTGVITLDPNGAELINGSSTLNITAGNIVLLQCDGTGLRTLLNTPIRLEPYIGLGVYLPETASTIVGVDGAKYVKTNTWVAYSADFTALAANPLAATNYNESRFTQATSGTSTDLRCITYGGGVFVAGGLAGTILTSPDGVTWTTQTSGIGPGILTLKYVNGLFFVINGNAGTFWSSPTGVTWTARVTGSLYGPVDIAWNGSEYLVLNGSDQFCRKSSNLTTWTGDFGNLGTVNPASVAYGASLWVGVSGAGAAIVSSPTGATWTVRTPGTGTGPFGSVIWDGAQFVAFRANGTYHTSADGITWSAVLNSGVGSTVDISKVSHDGSGTWAVTAKTYKGVPTIRVSTNLAGAVWTHQSCANLPDANNVGCTFGGGKLVLANAAGFIANVASNFSSSVQHIRYGDGTNATNPIGSLYGRYA